MSDAPAAQRKADTAHAYLLPLLMLLALGALWGGNPSFAKALAMAAVSPFAVVFWQTFIAGLILAAICLVRRVPIPLSAPALAYYAFIGWFGTAMSYSIVVLVVGHVTAGFVAVLVVLSPLLTYLFAVLMRLETIRLLPAAGTLTGLLGAALLVVPQGSLPSPDALPYALLALFIPAGYASSNVYAEWGRPAGAENVALAAGTLLAAAAATGLLGVATGSFLSLWSAPARTQLLLLGYGLSTAAAFMLFFVIVSRAGAVYLAQVGYLVTLAGIGWGMLFFGEQHSQWLWLAVIVTFAGVALVNIGKRGAGG